MSVIGQPDYQRGVSSAQIKLADVAAGTSSVVVGIPPNTETLVVIAPASLPNAPVLCTGQTTGYFYPGTVLPSSAGVISSTTYLFDVSSALDTQVTVSFQNGAPANAWKVYADAEAHIFVDPSKRVNYLGSLYVIPTLPSTNADHPSIELSLTSAFPGGTVQLLGAPGVGKRYRVFTIILAANSSALLGSVNDGPGGPALASVNGPGTVCVPLPAQGYPLTINNPLYYTLVGGSGGCAVSVYYTVETF